MRPFSVSLEVEASKNHFDHIALCILVVELCAGFVKPSLKNLRKLLHAKMFLVAEKHCSALF